MYAKIFAVWPMIFLAILIGCGVALQWAMLAAIGRSHGGFQAAWFSCLTTVAALGLVLLFRHFRTNSMITSDILSTRIEIISIITIVVGVVILLSLRDLPWWAGLSGLFGLGLILGAAWIVPSVGVAEFFVAVTVGSAVAGVIIDHVGLFGNATNVMTIPRVIAVLLVILGMAIIRLAGLLQSD
jgi:uncharacterized membrane protein YdcZ (DUF606 family)